MALSSSDIASLRNSVAPEDENQSQGQSELDAILGTGKSQAAVQGDTHPLDAILGTSQAAPQAPQETHPLDAILGTSQAPQAQEENPLDAILGTNKPTPGAPEAPEEKAGALGSIGQGVIQGFGSDPLFNGIHYLESIFPNAMGILNQLPGENGLDSVYGEGFSADTTTPQQRRDMIAAHNDAWKKSLINDYYQGKDTSDHPYLNKIGTVIGGLAGPSAFIAPEIDGATALARTGQVAVFGAKLGAVQGLSDAVATTGVPLNSQELAQAGADTLVGAAVGSTLGAVLHTAISDRAAVSELSTKIKSLLGDKVDSGEYMTPKQVAEAMGMEYKEPEVKPITPVYEQDVKDFPLGDPAKIAQDMNESFNLGRGPEHSLETAPGRY